MTVIRPRLLLTRRLPPMVEAHVGRIFTVDYNEADTPLPRLALATALQHYDAICPTITDSIDATLLATQGIKVRILANFGAGIDHINLAAARAAGIVVTNTPDALTKATAEIAFLLMLMAARRAGEGERELRAGRWAG